MLAALRFPSRSLLMAVVLAAPVMARPVTAQSGTLPLAPGTRVRVTAQTMVAPLVANFLRMHGDTAVFIEDGGGKGLWSIVVSDIRKLERSEGNRQSNRPYLIRGGLVGATVGVVGGLVFANNASPSDASRRYNKLGTGAVGALIGAAVGAAIGSRYSTENWIGVPLRTAAIVPNGRGLMASVRLAF